MRKPLFLLLLIMTISACSKYSYKHAVKNIPYDAVIVPGVPFNGTEWEDIMKMRVHWSVLLYERGITENIIYSGSAVYTPYYESVIMKLYALELGIPEDKIYTDTLAEHSTENVWYSYKLAKSKGFNKIALATDPFQNFVVKKFIGDHELHIEPIPIIFSEVDSFMSLPSPLIDPQKAYLENFKSIEDRESKWEQLKGTLGLKIEK